MEWYIECGGKYNINGQKVFGRKIFVPLEKVQEIAQTKFSNVDAYSTIYMYNKEDQNASDLIGPLYIDIDGQLDSEEGYAKVKQDALYTIAYINTHLKVPKEYIRLYFTGSKGFHIIVPNVVFGITPSKDLNDKYKRIALNIKKHTINQTIDTRIYDKKRLIRLPHSVNGKTGLYKVPLTEEVLRASTFNSIKLYASRDREIAITEAKFTEECKMAFNELTKPKERTKKKSNNASFVNPNFEIPNCIKLMYANGAISGERNNTLIILASALLQKGLELEECINAMEEWNENKNEPPISSNELDATVRSAYRNLMDGRRYGCASIQEMGACIGKGCKLYK